MGLTRVVGTLAGMLYSSLIFQYALTYTRYIFLGVACLYFVGFLSMCLMVKEGEYPPAPPLAQNKHGLSRLPATIRSYVAECLTHRIYRCFFAANALFRLSAVVGVYTILFQQALIGNDQPSLKKIGMLAFWSGIVGLCLHYPSGALADRFHPLRVIVVIQFALATTALLQFIWLFQKTWNPHTAYRLLLLFSLIDLPLWLLYLAAQMPMYMRLLPRDRYGQFCSFNALISASFDVMGSSVVGFFMVAMRHLFPDARYGKDFCYRLMPVWRFPFLIGGLICLVMLYKEWKRLGGKNYVPPQPEIAEPK
jgi:hypothetical protein